MTTYFKTLSIALVNTILIPFFIDIMVLLEDFPTKSARQTAILYRNFFFMLINTLLLPMTGEETIKQFLNKFLNEEV
jgi:hypothetical protein